MKTSETFPSTVGPSLPLSLLTPGTKFTLAAGAAAWKPDSAAVHALIRHHAWQGLSAVFTDGRLEYVPAHTRVCPLVGHDAQWAGAVRNTWNQAHDTVEEDQYLAEREMMRTGTPSLAAELAEDDRRAQNRGGMAL